MLGTSKPIPPFKITDLLPLTMQVFCCFKWTYKYKFPCSRKQMVKTICRTFKGIQLHFHFIYKTSGNSHSLALVKLSAVFKLWPVFIAIIKTCGYVPRGIRRHLRGEGVGGVQPYHRSEVDSLKKIAPLIA